MLVMFLLANVMIGRAQTDSGESIVSVSSVLELDKQRPLFVSPGVVDLIVTPDGMVTVYTGNVDGERNLFARRMDSGDVRSFENLGHDPGSPFISPDGMWIGYVDGATSIKKVSIKGGSPITICNLGPATGIARGVSWGPDDTIVFATTKNTSGLWRVSSNGGEPELLTIPNFDAGEIAHRWPEILPDGESIIFTRVMDPLERSEIVLLSLNSGQLKVLVRGYNPHYSQTGHLVYGAEGSLRAIRFDLDRLETVGKSRSLLKDVSSKPTGAMNASFSTTGRLVYVGTEVISNKTLGWVDQEGTMTSLMEIEDLWGYPRVSPDGKRIAFVVTRSGARDIWIHNLEQGVDTKLTEAGNNVFPTWTPDSSKVTFASNREGLYDLYSKLWHGKKEAKRLTSSKNSSISGSWTPDGQTLIYYEITETRKRDLLILGQGENPEIFLGTRFNERAPTFSYNGMWLAYVSDEEGYDQVVIQSFPVNGEESSFLTVSGTEPVWSRDSRELFYRHDSKMMVVEMNAGGSHDSATPRLLFHDPYEIDPAGQGNSNYDVWIADDQFLMISRDETSRANLVVIESWVDEIVDRPR